MNFLKAMPTMRKIGLFLSVVYGSIFGFIFSIIGMYKAIGRVMPIGVITSVLISLVISAIIGFLVPVKPLTDKICVKLHIDPFVSPLKVVLVQSAFMSIIMTFFIGTVFFIKNVGFSIPSYIFGFLLKEFWIETLIAFVVTFVLSKPLHNLAQKIFKVTLS